MSAAGHVNVSPKMAMATAAVSPQPSATPGTASISTCQISRSRVWSSTLNADSKMRIGRKT